MNTIKDNVINEIIIKNSRFITILNKINDANEVNEIIKHVRKQYPKATHYCYGFILNNYKKSSDDGEPSGTAGTPILNVLDKENIKNVISITVRYFGGIKLGVGGLVRAYTKSVKEALNKSKIIEIEDAKTIKLDVTYEEQKQLEFILKNEVILDKVYNEKITYTILIRNSLLNDLDKYSYKILNDSYIEKIS